jgi:hypothetical protein
MKSASLRIRVMDGGQMRVDLTFGAESALCLGRLVPPNVRQKLTERAIDLEAISASVRERDFAPGALFDIEDGTRRISGWLE